MTPSRRAACLMLTLLVLPLACNRPSKPVARVGGTWVGQPQWKLFHAELPAGTPQKTALDDLVRREVAWEQATRTGLLQGEGWREAEPKIRRAVLGRLYLESLPGRPMPTEQEIKGFYLSHSEERHVAHLLCLSEDAALAAKARIQKGEPFEKVADAVSIDPSKAKNHGDIGWIKRETVVPEFAQAVFAAKEGELCGPIHTQFGWHLAVVKARRSPTAEDFEKNKTRLMAEARELANGPKREEALKPLRDKYPVQADQAVLALGTASHPTPADALRVAGRIGGVAIQLKELDAYIFSAMGPGGPGHSLSATTKARFLDLLGDDVRLALAAEKAGLDKRPDGEAALWQAERQSVLQGFGVHYLRGLKVPDAELALHHDQHADRFRGIGAVRLYLLVATDEAAAIQAAKDAAAGTPWKKLVEKYANKASTGNWDPGFLEVAALQKVLPPELVQPMLSKPADSLVGPANGPDGPMLLKVLERRPGPTLPLDQCRDAVREDYLKTHAAELVEKYLDGDGRKGIRIQLYPENAGL